MTIREYLRRSSKRFFTFPGIGGHGSGDIDGWGRTGWLGGALPGSDTNWVKEAGDPSSNSVVAGCLRWIGDNLPEPQFCVQRTLRDGAVQCEPNHPLTAFLRRPNEEYDGDALMCATAFSYALSGNAFWVLDRDNLGRPARAWWIPHWSISPRWPANGGQFITDYLYRPSGSRGEGISIPKKNVVHFRWGLDPYSAGRMGVNRTIPVYRSIATINEVDTFTHSLLKQMGIIPYVISPTGPDVLVDPQTKTGIKQWFQALFTRDGRGRPLVMDGPFKIEKLGSSPEDMALDRLPTRSELRICAAFGIPPVVVFVGADLAKGLDNGGQHEQGRRAAYHDCIMPMTKRFAATLNYSLLPEFDARPSVRAAWDFSGVEALGDDQNALHERAREDYQKGILTRDEARACIGLGPVVDEEVSGGFLEAVSVAPELGSGTEAADDDNGSNKRSNQPPA